MWGKVLARRNLEEIKRRAIRGVGMSEWEGERKKFFENNGMVMREVEESRSRGSSDGKR